MDCGRRRAALNRVAAGEPPAAALEAHLAGCPECRASLERARRALAAADAELGVAARRSLPPGFEGRVLRALRDPARAPVRGPWVWRAAAAAVGLALAAAAGLLPERREPGVRTPVESGTPARAARLAGPGGAADASAPEAPESRRPSSDRTRAGGGTSLADDRFAGTARRETARTAEVRVAPGQLATLVRYARLRSKRPALGEPGAGAPVPSIGIEPIRTDPIRIEPLSVEPLSPAH